MSVTTKIKTRRRISTLLVVILGMIAVLVLAGLVITTARLLEIQRDLGSLRDSALPRLVKLSQLSQEAVATISIAPALSANPTRFEFETLLSRIRDKQASQEALIADLQLLMRDLEAAARLRQNGELLILNLNTLTDVVGDQIDVRKRVADRIDYLRSVAAALASANEDATSTESGNDQKIAQRQQAYLFVATILGTLLDPNSARFSRNRRELERQHEWLTGLLGTEASAVESAADAASTLPLELVQYWKSEAAQIYQDKEAELSNDFRIKALVEENALIANRLLSSANTEFSNASADLQTQIGTVDDTAQFTLFSMIAIVICFGIGNVVVWLVLKRRVFRRLDRISAALETYADRRDRLPADTVLDEIGAISGSLDHYMSVIDEREAELADKTRTLEQLSSQLAKYLSPQVYDSIFSGRQEVKVASSRKKLTIFFSDIAGFTETADRLESEELSGLLNHYLTEMSRIALDHGATIDKYVGDAILIFFGDPQSRGVEADALACVSMAIDMREKMHELAEVWRRSGIERPLQVRMGIHTGFCTVGNFGSEDRLDYTIIGSAVNTASRLEALAKPGEILVSYETFALVQDQIMCEEFGAVDVKGIAYPVATYRVVHSYSNLESDRHHFSERHPKMTLDLDISRMNAAERADAASMLRRALSFILEKDKPDPN